MAGVFHFLIVLLAMGVPPTVAIGPPAGVPSQTQPTGNLDESGRVGVSVLASAADSSAGSKVPFDPEFIPLHLADVHGPRRFTFGEFTIEAGYVVGRGDTDWMAKFVVRRGDQEVYSGKVGSLVMAMHDGRADVLLLRNESGFTASETRYLKVPDGKQYTIEGLLAEFKLSLEALNTLLGQTSIHDTHRLGLLLDAGADINRIHRHGTLLFSAVVANSAESIRFLLERGADTEIAAVGTSWTPLQQAAWMGHTAAAGLLLDYGADLHSGNPLRHTPAMLAAISGQTETLEFFLERGVDLHGRTDQGDTLLALAAEQNRVETVRFLLDRGIDHLITNVHSLTALDAAAFRNHHEMVGLLIDHGVQTGRPQASYGRAMGVAAVSGRREVLYLFLDRGADVNGRDHFGSTPLHHAAMSGHLDIVDSLLKRGANPHLRDPDRRTPLEAARGKDVEERLRRAMADSSGQERPDSAGEDEAMASDL
jgi:ankyrin repeat protein